MTTFDSVCDERAKANCLTSMPAERYVTRLVFWLVIILCIPVPALFALLGLPHLSAVSVALSCVAGFVLGMPCLVLEGDDNWDADWGE
jgi:hypothetical protein